MPANVDAMPKELEHGAGGAAKTTKVSLRLIGNGEKMIDDCSSRAEPWHAKKEKRLSSSK